MDEAKTPWYVIYLIHSHVFAMDMVLRHMKPRNSVKSLLSYDLYTDAAMLSPCFADMDKETFKKLPNSTNAVESYNRCSKQPKPDILKVAMLYTYKLDMAAALESLAISKKAATSYLDMTPSAREKRAKQHSKARQKRMWQEDEEESGPPDKRRHCISGMYNSQSAPNSVMKVSVSLYRKATYHSGQV